MCKHGGVIEAVPSCSPHQMASPSIAFFIEPTGDIELVGSFDRFSGKQHINAGCFSPQTSLPNMNLNTLSRSIGDVLYEKGVFGHVTVDLISFPDPTSAEKHPLFLAVDINCHMTDYAAACFNFDLLMEGKLDEYTGQYYVEMKKEPEDLIDKEIMERTKEEKGELFEPRSFMLCRFLHHPGLATIQFNTFFHMCRLEQVTYRMEDRLGQLFNVYDCLQGGVLGLMTVGEHRKVAVTQMIEALNFLQNQAGIIPQRVPEEDIDNERMDEIGFSDVFQRVKNIYKAFEKRQKKKLQTDKISFMNDIMLAD